jgi:hypothetical protein
LKQPETALAPEFFLSRQISPKAYSVSQMAMNLSQFPLEIIQLVGKTLTSKDFQNLTNSNKSFRNARHEHIQIFQFYINDLKSTLEYRTLQSHEFYLFLERAPSTHIKKYLDSKYCQHDLEIFSRGLHIYLHRGREINDLVTKHLLDIGVQPTYEMFIKACIFGLQKTAESLLKIFDPSIENDFALGCACSNGQLSIVKMLLDVPFVNPQSNRNFAISIASEKGYLEIVKLLLKDRRVDPSDNNNHAIMFASRYGHAEIVGLLLKDSRVDPSSDRNYAIREASANGFEKVVRLLMDCRRVDSSALRNEAIMRQVPEDIIWLFNCYWATGESILVPTTITLLEKQPLGATLEL